MKYDWHDAQSENHISRCSLKNCCWNKRASESLTGGAPGLGSERGPCRWRVCVNSAVLHDGSAASLSVQTKEVVPDPELVRKLNWFCSPVLALSDGSSGAPSSLELTYITDFFLALAICNSVVVSSATQPRHAVSRACVCVCVCILCVPNCGLLWWLGTNTKTSPSQSLFINYLN